MVKNFNLKVALAFTFIAFLNSVVVIGCNKQSNIQMEAMSDEQIIKAILNKQEYTEINKNLIKIIELSKNNSFSKVNIEDFNLVVKNVNSKSTATKFLKELGLVNYDEIVNINEQNFNLFQKIISEIPSLKNKSINQISSLFDKAYIENERNYTQAERLKYVAMDICSSTYGNGMNSCGNLLAIELATAATAGAAGALAGTPAAGGLLFFGGTAIAYIHNISCRQDVVSAWTQCRKEHPIH
jgi:hypothetical protein